jgi:DNA primase
MISDRIKRDAYIRKLATMISIDERSLYEELQRTLRGSRATTGITAAFSEPATRAGTRGAAQPGQPGAKEREPEWVSGEQEAQTRPGASAHQQRYGLDSGRTNRIQWEDYLIGLLLQNPGLSLHVCGIINDGDFAGTDTRELYHILNSVYQQRASSPSHQPFEQYIPSALLATVARAQKCVESRSLKDGAGLVKEAIQCATRLKRTRLLQRNTELRYLIDEATHAGDSAGVRQLRQRLSEIYRELRTIDTATHLQG